VSPPEREHSVGQRLLLAFYQAVDYLVVGVETMIVGAGVVLPWAVLAGIVWLVYRWRRRGRSPAPCSALLRQGAAPHSGGDASLCGRRLVRYPHTGGITMGG